MKVIILAAGIGSRLRPLTNEIPKALVKIQGKPILEHQISNYLKAGLKEEDIYVVIGYKNELIEKFIKSKYPKVNIIYNKEYETTNNMYSLYLALKNLDINSNENIIVNNGDCIYEFDIIKKIISSNGTDLIACDRSIYLKESMKIKVKDGRVIKISKQIPEEESYAVSIDLYKFSSKAILKLKKIIEDYIKKDKNKWTEEAIQILLDDVNIKPFEISALKWAEIDNYDDLLHAEKLFSNFKLSSKKALILDLDGTVYLGSSPIKSAIDFINKNWNNFKFYFITNNTSKSKNDYVKKLKNFGLKQVSIGNIITPIDSLIEFLKKENIKKIFCLGTKNFKLELERNGFFCIDDYNPNDIDAVVVGFDTELTYEKLKTACLLLQHHNIKYFATHTDKICPTKDGFIPDIGSILSLIKTATGREPEKTFGKPNPELIRPILNKFNNDEIVIIGDRLYTDKKLADNLNIDFILVLTGETKIEDLQKETNFPKLILKNLGELV